MDSLHHIYILQEPSTCLRVRKEGLKLHHCYAICSEGSFVTNHTLSVIHFLPLFLLNSETVFPVIGWLRNIICMQCFYHIVCWPYLQQMCFLLCIYALTKLLQTMKIRYVYFWPWLFGFIICIINENETSAE